MTKVKNETRATLYAIGCIILMFLWLFFVAFGLFKLLELPNRENEALNQYSVTVDGVEVSFPISYDEFSKTTGFSINGFQQQLTLQPRHFLAAVGVQNGTKNFDVYIVNRTMSEKALTNCEVAGVFVDDYSNVDITFPKELTIGTSCSKTSLRDLYGKPDKTYSEPLEDWFFSTYYPSGENNANKNCEVFVSGGVIRSVRYVCMENDFMP